MITAVDKICKQYFNNI